MNHINEILNKEKVALLYVRMKLNDRNARNQLIESNINLVGHIIKSYVDDKSDVDDLISVGCIGLIKAVDTYDIERGVSLCAYASKCIRNEILMYLQKNRKCSKNISIDANIFDFSSDSGDELSLVEMLEAPDSDFVEEVCDNYDLIKKRKLIMSIISTLNVVEQYIILMHYGFIDGKTHTQKEIGETFGVTKSYISRLEKKALCKLKDFKPLQHLCEYN